MNTGAELTSTGTSGAGQYLTFCLEADEWRHWRAQLMALADRRKGTC